MSATTTATTTSASATSSCYAKLYDIPVKDAACAMPMKGNFSSVMSSCCGEASVVEYDNCDYYCLAQGQTIGTLAECLEEGSAAGEFWCNTNSNATATATATATGTGVVTLSGTSTGADSTASGTSTGATSTSTSSSAGIVASRPLSKSAIGVVGILLAGSAAGLFL